MILQMCGAASSKTVRANCSSYQIWYYFNLLVDVFFLCDILVNLRTGYVREGRLELGDAKAARNYLKGSFTFDLCILVRHRTHGITRCPTCPPPLR